MPLKLNNLSKKFGEKAIFENFSYEFDKSGLYIIKGESGIGKTTLLRMIAGLDNEYNGGIENGGVKNISFMFQEYRLFPTLTALKNAAISSPADSEKAAEILIKLGFTREDLSKFPRELSGGMKQRVAFVRALIKDSPILILDEPTKELDQHTVNTMLSVIENESQHRLVIMVTHDDMDGKINDSRIINLS